jgi:hypothetical protein
LDFARPLAMQNGDPLGAAMVAMQLCAARGRHAGRHVERMGNSGLMLNPSYIKGMEEYLKGVGGKK